MAKKHIDPLAGSLNTEIDKEISQDEGNEQAGNDPIPGDDIAVNAKTDEPVVTNPTSNAEGTGKGLDPADNLDDAALDTDLIDENQVTEPVTVAQNRGDEGDVPVDLDNSSKFKAGHNEDGHRNMFRNRFGQVTILDDDTAKVLFENPSFYSYVYDACRHENAHVSTLEWCDQNGKGIGERVGEGYTINE